MPNIKEMREEALKLQADAKKVIDLADSEKRDLTKEEEEQVDGLFAKYDGLKEKIEKQEKADDRRKKLDAAQNWLESSAGRTVEPQAPQQTPEGNAGEIVNIDFGNNRSISFEPGSDEHRRASNDYRKAFNSYLLTGLSGIQRMNVGAALQVDKDVDGGYLTAPIQLVAELIKFLDNEVFMRKIGRVLPPVTSAQGLGFPSLDADPADADWTSELATGSEDSTMAFGKRELRPHPLAKRIKVSKKLLQIAIMNAEQLVKERLGYKFAVTEENAFLNGSGSNQPLGVFTASDDGISTSRDVSTDNTSISIKVDGLINALYSLKGQYQSRATWLFHRDALKQIRKLKDGEGQYLWQASVQAGQPDRLINRPIIMSEYAPNTFTTGLYVGIVGDFSYYWIVDALDMTIQTLLELYAETNQIGMIGRKETDGLPVLEEAFARVKLA